MTDKQIIADVVLNDKNNSQPAPFLGWVRIVGQDKIHVINFQTGMQHIVENYGKQVFTFLPVRKDDEIHIEGNFLWGRFYGLMMEDNQ
jgi:hypothetical protein